MTEFVQAQQQGLTKREVYDFEVGDVFQTAFEVSDWLPPLLVKKTVVEKVFSSVSDTITYVFDVNKYRQKYFSYDAIHENYSDTLTVTNLDSLAVHFELFSPVEFMYGLAQSSLYCDSTVWYMSTGQDTISFEPSYFTSALVKGAGGPYYSAHYGFSGQGYTETLELIYFKKSGIECGNMISGVSEKVNLLEAAILSPNPTTGKVFISIDTKTNLDKIMVVNSLGQTTEIYASDKTSIDLSQFPEGVYQLLIFDNSSGLVQTKKVIKVN